MDEPACAAEVNDPVVAVFADDDQLRARDELAHLLAAAVRYGVYVGRLVGGDEARIAHDKIRLQPALNIGLLHGVPDVDIDPVPLIIQDVQEGAVVQIGDPLGADVGFLLMTMAG